MCIRDRIQSADILICHAGNGTLMHALRHGKVPVVMPRMRKYAEHIDDHQMDLVELLSEENRIIPAYEVSQLPAAIEEAWRRGTNVAERPEPPLIAMIRADLHYLDLHGRLPPFS